MLSVESGGYAARRADVRRRGGGDRVAVHGRWWTTIPDARRLAVLVGGEASDQVDGSMLDIAATVGKAVEERRGVKEPSLVGAGNAGPEMPELGGEGDASNACAAARKEEGRLCALPLTLRLVEGREIARS